MVLARARRYYINLYYLHRTPQISLIEIARLQNSLSHLKRTQDGLEEAISESRDPEFVQALEENAGVMCVIRLPDFHGEPPPTISDQCSRLEVVHVAVVRRKSG